MDIEQSSAGKILQSPKGYKAFLPYPLPPNIEWNNRLVAALSRADFLLGKLAREGVDYQIPTFLYAPLLLGRLFYQAKLKGHKLPLGKS